MAESKVDCAVKPCPLKDKKVIANIVSVEFLDGSDTKIVTGTAEQLVNLPAEDKWVDGKKVKNKDRLSNKPRIKVKFDKAGTHPFKIKLVPAGTNTVYTGDEKFRNNNFTFDSLEKEYTTGPDGTVILSGSLSLTAAGNDIYSLSAKDNNGNTVTSSGKIKTVRFFYLVEIKMNGLRSVAGNLKGLIKEFLSNYIKISKLSHVFMDHMENISTSDNSTFESKARIAYNTSDGINKKPYCIAVAYTDHLAVKNPSKEQFKYNVRVGPGASPVTIPIQGRGLTDPAIESRCLWNNLVTGEDWFVSCKFVYTDLLHFSLPPVDIPKDKCKILLTIPPGGYEKVSISVNHIPVGEGNIKLIVNWVDRMRAGMEFPGGNLICVCTRAWWQNENTKSQNQTMIHEMGHKVGMVASGAGKLPEKVATYYDDLKGHKGPHCYFGNPDYQARYDSATDRNRSRCVMYGETNGISSFCSNCKKALRKLDISKGWSTL